MQNFYKCRTFTMDSSKSPSGGDTAGSGSKSTLLRSISPKTNYGGGEAI